MITELLGPSPDPSMLTRAHTGTNQRPLSLRCRNRPAVWLWPPRALLSQTYTLQHYQDDSFTWIMPFNEIIRRARSATYYTPEYYIVDFVGDENGEIDWLAWVMESDLPNNGGRKVFKKGPSPPGSSVTWSVNYMKYLTKPNIRVEASRRCSLRNKHRI